MKKIILGLVLLTLLVAMVRADLILNEDLVLNESKIRFLDTVPFFNDIGSAAEPAHFAYFHETYAKRQAFVGINDDSEQLDTHLLVVHKAPGTNADCLIAAYDRSANVSIGRGTMLFDTCGDVYQGNWWVRFGIDNFNWNLYPYSRTEIRPYNIQTNRINSISRNPFINLGQGSGVGSTVSIDGTVMGGIITLTTGNAIMSPNMELFDVAFHRDYNEKNWATLTPANHNAASLAVYVNDEERSDGFTVYKATKISSNTVYKWTYTVTGK